MKYSLRDKPRRLSKDKKKQLIADCIKIWKKHNPDPKSELYHKTSYQLLVSVVLSAQTTDKMVNKVMTGIYKNKFNMNTVLSLKEAGVYKIIKSIGLAPTKAKNIYNLTRMLIDKFKGLIPDNRSDLESLPGVGRKTANVILGELFKQPTLAVDTHVFRVSARLGLQQEKDVKKAEQLLLQLIPKKYLPITHHWFILHGRYTCKARKPLCSICCVNDICPSVDVSS